MIRSVHRRVANVIAAVEAVREVHEPFLKPATPRAVWHCLAAEGIRVRRGRIHAKARASVFDGEALITLRETLPRGEAWKWALHEYGHVRLHFPDHDEHVRNLEPCHPDDPREDEATLFALLLAIGPTATPETPGVARFVAKMIGRDMMSGRPAQYDFLLPETYDWAGHWRKVFALSGYVRRSYEELDSIAGSVGPPVWQKYANWPQPTRPEREAVKPSEDFTRIELRDGKPAIYTDVTGRRWLIANYRRARVGDNPDDERWWRKIESFASPEVTHRLFVSPAGERRLYAFKDLKRRPEARAYRVKHLDRQIAQATKLSPRTAVRSSRSSPAPRPARLNGDVQ